MWHIVACGDMSQFPDGMIDGERGVDRKKQCYEEI